MDSYQNNNEPKLTFFQAVRLNTNMMIGGAVFLALATIADLGPLLGTLAWFVGGLFFLPLAYVFGDLASRFPFAGGLYVYPRQAFGQGLATVVGVIFFTAVTLGNAAVLVAFWDAIAKIFPELSATLGFLVCKYTSIIVIFILSVMGTRVLSAIDGLISIFKVLAITLVLLGAAIFFMPAKILVFKASASVLSRVFPLIIFNFIGLEACCAIAHQVRSVSKVARLSLIVTVLICVLLQIAAGVSSVGLVYSGTPSGSVFVDAFAIFGTIAMLAAYLGSAFGGICSNNWNLYALFQNTSSAHNRAFFLFCAVLQFLLVVLFFLFSQNLLGLLNWSVFVTCSVYAVVLASYVKIFDWNRVRVKASFAALSVFLILIASLWLALNP